jgi:hypothetical protein
LLRRTFVITIENVEARLNKLTEDFGKVSQQLDNYRKAELYFLNNQHRDRFSPAFEYSNMADMGNSTREKLCCEKATSTIDLTVNGRVNDVNSVVESSPDNMPPIEILDKATSTIDLTVNNQINNANVVEFSPENMPPIEILDRATENCRSNQSCIILNSCSGSSKQDAIPLDVRNQIDETCDKTNFQSNSTPIQNISTRITSQWPPVNIIQLLWSGTRSIRYMMTQTFKVFQLKLHADPKIDRRNGMRKQIGTVLLISTGQSIIYAYRNRSKGVYLAMVNRLNEIKKRIFVLITSENGSETN